MTRGSELIREIVDRPRDEFRPRREGFLFIGKEGISERYLTLQCLMMIDNFLKTYQEFIEGGIDIDKAHAEKLGFPQMLAHTLRELKVSKLKDKDDALLRYNGFYACASSVPGYVPFYYNRALRLFPLAQIISLYFSKIYGDSEEILHLKETARVFRQILPFDTTCDAKIQRIGQAFEQMVKNCQGDIFHGICKCPRVYGIKVEIHKNALLELMKRTIEDIMKAKMSLWPVGFEYAHALSEEAPNPELARRCSLMFHVTVLGENAFLGYYKDPHRSRYNRFSFTEADIMNYYKEMCEEEEECTEDEVG